MNEELPEPLNRFSPPAAPRALRQRTLVAVNQELTMRRKPRWERVLELSVAATFVLGVGLNADLLTSGIKKFTTNREQELLDFDREAMAARDGKRPDAAVGSFESSYARYLAQLSAKPAG